MYMPQYSFFGDYHILKGLKPNILFKTMPCHSQLPEQDNLFMCVSKEAFNNLCDLFPQTKQNLIRKSLDRRKRFMKAKNLNSRKYWKLRGMPPYENRPRKINNNLDESILDRVHH